MVQQLAILHSWWLFQILLQKCWNIWNDHLDYLSRGDSLTLCPVGSAHMEKVKGHHFLFYLPAVINSFFHSHPENAREKAKGNAWLMGG
jgi:hypothetical protein